MHIKLLISLVFTDPYLSQFLSLYICNDAMLRNITIYLYKQYTTQMNTCTVILIIYSSAVTDTTLMVEDVELDRPLLP